MIKKLLLLLKITGKKVRLTLILASVTGIFLFIAEYLFIIVLQSFLVTIGIADPTKVAIPDWLPNGTKYSLLCLLVIGSIKILVQMSKTYLTSSANQTFLKEQRLILMRYSMYNAERTNSHEMTSYLTDVLARSGSAVLDLTGLTTIFTSTSLLFITGISIAPYEMLIGVIGLGLAWFPIKFIDRYINEAGAGLTKNWELVTKYLLDSIRHNYFFRSHGIEENHLNNSSKSINQYEVHYNKFFKYSALKNGFPNFAGICLICIITYVSLNYFNTKGPQLLAFLYLFIKVAQSAGELSATLSHLRLNLDSVENLIKLSQEVNVSSNKEIFHTKSYKDYPIRDITCSNMSFRYNTDHYLFKDINFNLAPGDIYIILGKSGSGKSTFLSLLLNINQPSNGKITINNKDLNEVQLELKPSTAYIGPEPFLFTGTIRENLLYGNLRTNITDSEINTALELSEAKDFVYQKKRSLNFIIDEHAEISTGQKQRLSICRAILRKPKLLILDEATANLDGGTEHSILTSLKNELKTTIIFIVTHKKNLVSFGNYLLDLDSNPPRQTKIN